MRRGGRVGPVTERLEDRADPSGDAERARIRKMLRDRGVLPIHLTEQLMDFWIVQDAKDQEEGRSLEYRRPGHLFYGGGE